jgi:hypothetical protein
MPTSRSQMAFLAAALVLLVLPVLVMLGLSALGAAMHFGMMSQMEGMMNGEECRVPRALHRMGPDRARCRVRACVTIGSCNPLLRNRGHAR